MNRMVRWLMDILEAEVWRGTAAGGQEYENWRAPLPPPSDAERAPPAAPEGSSTPGKKPAAERKVA